MKTSLQTHSTTPATNTSSAKNVSISADIASQRIDNFLRTQLKGVPKSLLYRLLRQGVVRVNGKRIKADYKLCAGDEVRLPPIRTSGRQTAGVSPNLRKVAALQQAIIYEDDYLLVLNKPTGMAVHGGSGLSFGVIEGLRALRPQAHFLELVHRLDRDTSGLLLVAKKRSALRALHEQLRDKQMQKDYLALVHGHWPAQLKLIQAALLKNILQSGERHVLVSPDGKPSQTRFHVEERFACATLLRCTPITGRTHQIRVHTRHSGHPIAFDPRYGDQQRDQKLADTGLHRLFLHATALRFSHPHSGETLSLEAELDQPLSQCLHSLRKMTALRS